MSLERFVIVDQPVLAGGPARAVSYLEPEDDWDSGFAVFAGGPDDEHEFDLICVDCLLEERTDLGRGMDLAREHGEAILDRGEWSPRGEGR